MGQGAGPRDGAARARAPPGHAGGGALADRTAENSKWLSMGVDQAQLQTQQLRAIEAGRAKGGRNPTAQLATSSTSHDPGPRLTITTTGSGRVATFSFTDDVHVESPWSRRSGSNDGGLGRSSRGSGNRSWGDGDAEGEVGWDTGNRSFGSSSPMSRAVPPEMRTSFDASMPLPPTPIWGHTGG